MRNLLAISPPGMGAQQWKHYFLWALVLSVGFSVVSFSSGLYTALQELYIPGTKELYEDAVMQPFDKVLGSAMVLFEIMAAGMAVFVFANYRYFFHESKSIYTMRRIGRPMQLHIRCWTLPLAGAGALLTLRLLIPQVYYLCYLLATPKGCLPPQ